MQIKKIIIITAGVLALSLLGYFLTKKTQIQNTANTPQDISNQPSSAKLNLPTGEKFTASGVQINNIYKSASTITDKGDAVFSDTDAYQNIYYPQNQLFLVSVLKSPFETARKQAEEDFLKKLGINKSDACKLNVSVTTPYWVNSNEAGKDFKLSFCN